MIVMIHLQHLPFLLSLLESYFNFFGSQGAVGYFSNERGFSVMVDFILKGIWLNSLLWQPSNWLVVIQT